MMFPVKQQHRLSIAKKAFCAFPSTFGDLPTLKAQHELFISKILSHTESWSDAEMKQKHEDTATSSQRVHKIQIRSLERQCSNGKETGQQMDVPCCSNF